MSRRRSAGPVCLEQIGTELEPSTSTSTSTGSQNTMPSHKPSQPLPPMYPKPNNKAATSLILRLYPLIAWSHIDPKYWEQLQITCSKLDLSWESENGGNFLRLMTHEQMRRIARQYAFDQIRDPSRDPRHPFHDSDHMASYLSRHLDATSDDGKTLVEQLPWDCNPPDHVMLNKLRYFPAGCNWAVENILDVKGASLPHINCTLTEAGELDESTLMFSEVWCILWLTIHCHRDPQKAKFEVVPVTVATISGPTFRIVQGYVDGKTGIVNIRKSAIVPIGPDKNTMKEQMMLMVRWLIAEPVWPSRH
ncbi:hypothetical protein F5B22DRAFT_87296 [Xylaria bambusicola]|uniref:uncharacterized protein n=1 Tax=Xylaria bambusicola TaxID=326684 RepID=UPI00200858DA|nr:uncharacterized protein F5B22DRAFT_87296 [Xylaria bambusicola]KAI0517991.1 hypothetical protein F5B22DRAFT_87296 [Xylaria bambusicola]